MVLPSLSEQKQMSLYGRTTYSLNMMLVDSVNLTPCDSFSAFKVLGKESAFKGVAAYPTHFQLLQLQTATI